MNDVDNCPLVPNPNQLNKDGNGRGDVCENDFDGDSKSDLVDNCPNNGQITGTDFRGIQAITLVGSFDPFVSFIDAALKSIYILSKTSLVMRIFIHSNICAVLLSSKPQHSCFL